MGSNLSAELTDKELFPDITLEQSVTIQLRSNHYPPVPYEMVPICVEAIHACNELDYNREIELPEGISFRGKNTAPANEIVSQHHLENWVDWE